MAPATSVAPQSSHPIDLPDTPESRRAVDRRGFLAAAGAALLATTQSWPCLALTSPTFRLGAFEITMLSDGYLTVPRRFLASTTDSKDLDVVLAAAGQRGEWVPAPSNVTLVCTGSEVILIDAGAGPHFMPTTGKLLDSLGLAGIERNSITKVVYTHAHPDHIWGTLDDFDDEPNFPNASYVIAAAEWNFWMSPDAASKLPEDRQNLAAGAKRNLSRIKDRVRTVRPGEDISPGLRALDTSGHTAGHIAIEVATGPQGLLVVGDALTHPVISFEHPDWRPAADHHDADLAVATRRRLLDRLATDRTPLIGYHLPFPGIGRVERKGTAYAFVRGW
jgi:glyoxylase-like metal-dependent hydrolase (beta-lactamase superfamily II)